MSRKSWLFFLAMTLLLCNACRTSYSPDIEFFHEMDRVLTPEQRSRLLQCGDMQCVDRFIFWKGSWNKELGQLYADIPADVTAMLDSVELDGYKHFALLKAYADSRNNRPLSFKQIDIEIKDYVTEQAELSEIRSKAWDAEMDQMARRNHDNIRTGDTLLMTFPVEYSDGFCDAAYRAPFEDADTLFVAGILLDKTEVIQEDYCGELTYRPDFKIKIIGMDHAPCRFMLGVIDCGGVLDIGIRHYNTVIHKIADVPDPVATAVLEGCRQR